jgi:DNA-binding NarL/FixJ family response regulator
LQTREIENSTLYPDGLPHAAAAGATTANPHRLDELTKREREVLSLLAQGLTDRAISQKLWLTPKTVETHVRHILAKLNLPTGTHHNRRVLAVLTYLQENASGPAVTHHQ